MSRLVFVWGASRFSFPRLRGDEPDYEVIIDTGEVFSPPTRG